MITLPLWVFGLIILGTLSAGLLISALTIILIGSSATLAELDDRQTTDGSNHADR